MFPRLPFSPMQAECLWMSGTRGWKCPNPPTCFVASTSQNTHLPHREDERGAQKILSRLNSCQSHEKCITLMLWIDLLSYFGLVIELKFPKKSVMNLLWVRDLGTVPVRTWPGKWLILLYSFIVLQSTESTFLFGVWKIWNIHCNLLIARGWLLSFMNHSMRSGQPWGIQRSWRSCLYSVKPPHFFLHCVKY